MAISMADGIRANQGGFTLIEMVMVITLVGILAATTVVFVLPPVKAARDIERRAVVVEAADMALDRLSREARSALPNSVRVPAANHVEFILIHDAGSYRRLPAGDGSGDTFAPARASDSFDVLGGLTDPAAASGRLFSVYNTGQPGFDAWDGDNLATIDSATGDSISYTVTGSGFKAHSPAQRFYILETPVSYICDGNQLRRYSNYDLGESHLNGTSELMTGNISSCNFTYSAGTATRRGLLTLRLDLVHQGEQVFLLAQAQVSNSP